MLRIRHKHPIAEKKAHPLVTETAAIIINIIEKKAHITVTETAAAMIHYSDATTTNNKRPLFSIFLLMARKVGISSRAIAFENQKIIREVQEEIISSWWVQ
ncbi:hypothetical protein, partial [Candidatus Magnetaquicoccus inordinatus]|uniref:hypothetical protein n=1 Tax=Candidatus Magnetaquicoccus inordinatus TaxID=2496818 RepID=UPI001D0F1139